MYIVVLFRGDTIRFISNINYKKQFWECDGSPKIFKRKESALKCRNQVYEWATGFEKYSVCSLFGGFSNSKHRDTK